eukprot:Nk52_evm11s219 gene=Nk52_evmTU11s219
MEEFFVATHSPSDTPLAVGPFAGSTEITATGTSIGDGIQKEEPKIEAGGTDDSFDDSASTDVPGEVEIQIPPRHNESKSEKDQRGQIQQGKENDASNAVTKQKERGIKVAITILTREKSLKKLVRTIQVFEESYNTRFGHDYIIMNDGRFSAHFKQKVRELTNNTVHFYRIPHDVWAVPEHIDDVQMRQGMENLLRKVSWMPYAKSVSYRQMCRFQSGPVFMLPILKNYDWFWRLDDDVHYFCKLDYDPLQYMKDNGIVYGFSIAFKEFIQTVETLYPTILQFAEKYPHLVKTEDHTNDWMTYFGSSNVYNGCHFWTNMEMGDLNFFRGEAYQSFFRHLDQAGGFFYERWGDAPVRSLGLGLLVDKDRVKLFEDIGYTHGGHYRCDPSLPQCDCNLWNVAGYNKNSQFTNVRQDPPESRNCNARFLKHKTSYPAFPS